MQLESAVVDAHVEQFLVSKLEPGDVVIMDNLPAHKVKGMQEKIEGVGAALNYLPPYSPDFNPIGKAFSQIKSYLKKVAARTKEEFEINIAKAIELVTEQIAGKFFRACGYNVDAI